ncbi:unnamed protein product [Staurois parvus]|uniref:Uncharacterized protein n=1 Tax=Staurois parvus TaxID=386267 RepID=A0ABN9AFC2_9NEOB|nr:unnamed protein product [Staurois parvus]
MGPPIDPGHGVQCPSFQMVSPPLSGTMVSKSSHPLTGSYSSKKNWTFGVSKSKRRDFYEL